MDYFKQGAKKMGQGLGDGISKIGKKSQDAVVSTTRGTARSVGGWGDRMRGQGAGGEFQRIRADSMEEMDMPQGLEGVEEDELETKGRSQWASKLKSAAGSTVGVLKSALVVNVFSEEEKELMRKAEEARQLRNRTDPEQQQDGQQAEANAWESDEGDPLSGSSHQAGSRGGSLGGSPQQSAQTGDAVAVEPLGEQCEYGWCTMDYMVDPGDTVARLAKKFDMTPEQLRGLNGLGDEPLQADSVLKVREWAHDGTVSTTASSSWQGSILGKGAKAGVHSSVPETFGSSNSMSEDEIEVHLQREEEKLRMALERAELRVKEMEQEKIVGNSSGLVLDTGETVQNASKLFDAENIEDEDESSSRCCWCFFRPSAYQQLDISTADLNQESPMPSPARFEIESADETLT